MCVWCVQAWLRVCQLSLLHPLPEEKKISDLIGFSAALMHPGHNNNCRLNLYQSLEENPHISAGLAILSYRNPPKKS